MVTKLMTLILLLNSSYLFATDDKEGQAPIIKIDDDKKLEIICAYPIINQFIKEQLEAKKVKEVELNTADGLTISFTASSRSKKYDLHIQPSAGCAYIFQK